MSSEPFTLEMEDIAKRFGATVALDGVSLAARCGEVHALIGENGAGKSTLMKILSGALRPDRGVMRLGGEEYAPRGPADARRRGIAMIYQELTVAPHLSVADNVFLGREASRWGWVDRRRSRERVREALDVLDHAEISPEERVGVLGISAQQLVEVARALVADARVIIFDEPTSSLSRLDTRRLFSVIRRLRDRGVAVIYISHFLEEVQEVSDRFTVLRDGKTVGGGAMGENDLAAIIELMVGRSVDEMFPRQPHAIGEPLFEIDGLSGARLPRDARLTLHRGEILGVAGLVGAGRTEMLRAVFGLEPVRAGRVRVAAFGDITGAGPPRAIRSGLGLLSEDRKDEGLLLNLSLADNIALVDYRPFTRGSAWIDRRAQHRATQRWLDTLGIKARGPRQAIGDLSGGNQQKAALARLLHQDADVLLLDEPTRGIDVGSKVQIYELMGELAARGKGILFVSSYLPELLGIADRVCVMNRGRLSGPRPVEQLDEETVMRLATIGENDELGAPDAGGTSSVRTGEERDATL